jgi:glycosyltransferase involved in cell wall biosynthesis
MRSDIPRLYSAFDVFALSSDTEGLPLVVPEAMASELPVVSTAVGGVPAVVRAGETGLLVPAADREALSAALAELAGDPARAAAMGAAGRALAHASLRARMASATRIYERARSAERS